MSRLPDLSPEQMTAAQRQVRDRIAAGPRGRAAGPFRVWLRSAELADRAQNLGEFLRFRTSLAPRLSELAILVTARAWSAQYEWLAHEPHAVAAGLAPEVIAAIADRRRPAFADAQEEAVYELASELHQRHFVADATYGRALERLGEQGTIELVALVGYYTMVAMTLNAFEVALPAGARPPLPP